MFDDILGKKKKVEKQYICSCPICSTVYRRDDYDVLFSVMSEHFVSEHGKIPKDFMIIEMQMLNIPARSLPEGFKITYKEVYEGGKTREEFFRQLTGEHQ